MRSDIVTLLQGDATLTATLTGGVHDGREITKELAAAAFDSNLELKPCALVKFSAETGDNAPMRTAAQVVSIFFYQRQGYAAISVAMERANVLLHNHKFNGGGRVELLNTVPETEDAGLNCSLGVARYGRSARKAA